MSREELLTKVKAYFDIRELVCRHVYNKFGVNSWLFISTELLSTLYTLRYKVIKKPMIVNNWVRGGSYSQRGMRCNQCQLVKSKTGVYMSAHCLGKAIDFHVADMTSEDIRTLIKENINQFEYPIRLEEDVNWVHIDCISNGQSKLITFKA